MAAGEPGGPPRRTSLWFRKTPSAKALHGVSKILYLDFTPRGLVEKKDKEAVWWMLKYGCGGSGIVASCKLTDFATTNIVAIQILMDKSIYARGLITSGVIGANEYCDSVSWFSPESEPS